VVIDTLVPLVAEAMPLGMTATPATASSVATAQARPIDRPQRRRWAHPRRCRVALCRAG
jgi:hypothetical protein